MKKGRTLLENAVRDLEASPRTSATTAGPAEPGAANSRTDSRVDAINQVFALFRLNFHNQYYSAFPDASQLSQIKKLWLDALAGEDPETILLAARRCIEDSEYLPTLHRFLVACREEKQRQAGLPDAATAFREACLAASPKAAQDWSHPAVYYAGREVGWFLLNSMPERQSRPLFEQAYQRLCQRVSGGEVLPPPAPPALPESMSCKPGREERRKSMARLREETGFGA